MTKNLVLIIICLLYSFDFISAQNSLPVAKCKQKVSFMSDYYLGELRIFPEDIDDNSYNFSSWKLSKSHFKCNEAGTHLIELHIYDDKGNHDSCTCELDLTSRLKPISVCVKQLPPLFLNPEGLLHLDTNMFDDGSYYMCSGFSELRVIPDIMTCDNLGQNTVMLMMRDYLGNTNYCDTKVEIKAPYSENIPLICQKNTSIGVGETKKGIITREMIVNSGPHTCLNQYDMIVYDSTGRIFENGAISSLDNVSNVTAVIIDPVSGNTCQTPVQIIDIGCPAAIICNTRCHAESDGNCENGERNQVIWPCDFEINSCIDKLQDLSPENMHQFLVHDSRDFEPTFHDHHCFEFSKSYTDQELADGNDLLVLRNWTVYDHHSKTSISYLQTIRIKNQILFICDTKAWDTPLGDCASGHTDSDMVEWPSNFSTDSAYILPANIFSSSPPDYQWRNAMPVISGVCLEPDITFTDAIVRINVHKKIVNRHWTVTDKVTRVQYRYLQQIEHNDDRMERRICAEYGSGDPLMQVFPDKNIDQQTDKMGCLIFQPFPFPDQAREFNKTLNPFKYSYGTRAMNVIDLVHAMNYKLNPDNNPFNAAKLSADIDNDKSITDADLIEIQKMIVGHNSDYLENRWQFYGLFEDDEIGDIEVFQFHRFIDFTYRLLGIYKGDVNLSYLKGDVISAEAFLKLDNISVSAGNTYQVPIYLTSPTPFQGLQLEFRTLNGIKWETVSVSSDQLSGLYQSINGGIDGNWTMVWSGLKDNFNINEPLLTIEFRAYSNGKMSDFFQLRSENNLMVYNPNNTDRLQFDWLNALKTQIKVDSGVKNLLMVTPNPSNRYIDIYLPEVSKHNLEFAEVSVLNFSGKSLLNQRIEFIDGKSNLDVSLLSSGIYLISVINSRGEKFIQKFIVQH